MAAPEDAVGEGREVKKYFSVDRREGAGVAIWKPGERSCRERSERSGQKELKRAACAMAWIARPV